MGKIRLYAGAVAVALVSIGLFGTGAHATGVSSGGDRLVVDEFRLGDAAMTQLKDSFYDQIEAKYAPGQWAPLRMELGDADLAAMGLPSRSALQAADLSRPAVFAAGKKGPQPAAGGPGV